MWRLKALNLYAGIGGNRKLWHPEVQVTAVEQNAEIAAVYKHYFPQDILIVGDAHQYLLDHYHEFDYIWSSPPCQTHSKARLWNAKNNFKIERKYPDMKLYQEILFLKHYFNGGWDVENVDPFYTPMVPPTIKLGRHLFWSSHYISKINTKEADVVEGKRDDWQDMHGFDLSGFKMANRKDQVLRNCVHPETGLHVLNCFLGTQNKNIKQQQLFA